MKNEKGWEKKTIKPSMAGNLVRGRRSIAEEDLLGNCSSFIFHLSSFILAFSAEMIQSEKSYNLPCPVSLISRGLCQLCLVGFSAKLLQVQLGFEYMIFFFLFFFPV